MKTLLCLCFLYVILGVGAIGRETGVVDENFYVVRKGMENSAKCHVRQTWLSITSPYRMVCFECNDNRKSVIVYHGEVPVDAVGVESSNKIWLPLSITLIPPTNAQPSTHTLDYEMVDGNCVRVDVLRGEVSKRRKCDEVRRTKRKLIKDYINGQVNGWKLQTNPPMRGVVREVLEDKKVPNCPMVDTWNHAGDEAFTMKCLDCEQAYYAVLYYGGNVVQLVDVGSCKPYNIESSIILQTSPSGIKAHYLFFTDECDTMSFVKNDMSFVKETRCTYTKRNKLWRKKPDPVLKGVVIELSQYTTTHGCSLENKWEYRDKSVTLECYKCSYGDEFRAFLYMGELKMDVWRVKTCMFPQLSDSIDLERSSNEYTAHYYLTTKKCVKRYYTKIGDTVNMLEDPVCKYKGYENNEAFKDYDFIWTLL